MSSKVIKIVVVRGGAQLSLLGLGGEDDLYDLVPPLSQSPTRGRLVAWTVSIHLLV